VPSMSLTIRSVPALIAHRGSSFDAPENTTAAFDQAVADGATAIELDVHLTKDGQLLVWHDEGLERTARMPGGVPSGALASIPFDEIALCDSGSWFNEAFPDRARAEFVGLCPLTLDDVLRRYGRRIDLFVELKNVGRSSGMAQAVVAAIDPHSTGRRHRIMSDDALALSKLHVERPDLELIQLLPHRGSWRLHLSEVARYAAAIAPLYTMAGRELIEAAHAFGLQAYPYTVNDTAVAEKLVTVGADGLITDTPARLLAPSRGPSLVDL
jgi:glycerophosphoryl diester phosphodiesterase